VAGPPDRHDLEDVLKVQDEQLYEEWTRCGGPVRASRLDAEDYLDHYFDTGIEHKR
jgi:hypothetical protein